MYNLVPNALSSSLATVQNTRKRLWERGCNLLILLFILDILCVTTTLPTLHGVCLEKDVLWTELQVS